MDNIDRYALEARLAEIEEALAELDAAEGDEALFDYEREMNEDDYADLLAEKSDIEAILAEMDDEGEDGEMEEVRLGVSRESDEDGFWDEIWDAYRDRRWTNYWNKSGIK